MVRLFISFYIVSASRLNISVFVLQMELLRNRLEQLQAFHVTTAAITKTGKGRADSMAEVSLLMITSTSIEKLTYQII